MAKRMTKEQKEAMEQEVKDIRKVSKEEQAKYDEAIQADVQGLASISKKVQESVVTIGKDDLRFLVDAYYQSQDDRKAKDNQVRSITQEVDGEGREVPSSMEWLAKNKRNEENQIKKMLDIYTDNHVIGRWAKETVGIGPVISAALLAYLDVTKCKNANQFLSYAGQNDNNNPWLGKEKAKELVGILKRIHQLKMNVVEDSLEAESLFGPKMKTGLKELGKLYDLEHDVYGCDMLKNMVFEPYFAANGKCDPVYEAEDQRDFTYKQAKAVRDMLKTYGSDLLDWAKNLDKCIDKKFVERQRKSLLNYMNDAYMVTDSKTIEIIDNLKETDKLSWDYEPFPYHLRLAKTEVSQIDMGHFTDPAQLLSDYCLWLANPNRVVPSLITTLGAISTKNPTSITNNIDTLMYGSKHGPQKKTLPKYLSYAEVAAMLAKPPYNADLKLICWKIGDSLLKRSNHPRSLYGRLYRERKQYELEKNRNYEYAGQVADALISKNWSDNTVTWDTYKDGRLTDAHIDARAKRYAVRIFLTHVFEIMYMNEYKIAPPKIYAMAYLDHSEYIAPEVAFGRFIDVPDEYYEQYGMPKVEYPRESK